MNKSRLLTLALVAATSLAAGSLTKRSTSVAPAPFGTTFPVTPPTNPDYPVSRDVFPDASFDVPGKLGMKRDLRWHLPGTIPPLGLGPVGRQVRIPPLSLGLVGPDIRIPPLGISPVGHSQAESGFESVSTVRPQGSVPQLGGGVQVQGVVRSVTTTGEATVYVVPDEFVIRLGIAITDADLTRAREEVENRARTMLQVVRNTGLPSDNIQTTQLSVSLGYANWEKREGLRYTVSRNYTFRLKDASKLAQTLDAALSNGANELHGIEMQSSEIRKHKDEARKLAARAAREKARLLAGELDARVGPVLTIAEQQYSDPIPYRFGNAMARETGGAIESGESLPAGQIAIKATVTATFSLE